MIICLCLLSALCACGKQPEKEPSTATEIYTHLPATGTDLPEEDGSVSGFRGNVTVNPADAAECEILYATGSLCEFTCSLSLRDFAAAFTEHYRCELSEISDDRALFRFLGEPAEDGKITTADYFLLQKSASVLMLHNLETTLVFSDGTFEKMLFPFHRLAKPASPRRSIEAGRAYELSESIFLQDFYDDAAVLMPNGRDFTVTSKNGTLLFSITPDGDTAYLTVSKYEEQPSTYTASLAESVKQTPLNTAPITPPGAQISI